MEDIFIPNEFYKHKKFKDICIRIVKYTGKDAVGSYFNIEYWNLGSMGRPWRIDKLYNFLIKNNDVENWDLLDENDMFTPRPKSYLYDIDNEN
jgi:hypothetical protein